MMPGSIPRSPRRGPASRHGSPTPICASRSPPSRHYRSGMHTGLFHTLDLDRDGKVLSHLGLPFSVDRSPYFQIKIPICVIRNGVGPSVLLMAGNHGDEYEGELSLARLIRRLDPARMRGRVTILPM